MNRAKKLRKAEESFIDEAPREPFGPNRPPAGYYPQDYEYPKQMEDLFEVAKPKFGLEQYLQ
jgi:hypothetical protein